VKIQKSIGYYRSGNIRYELWHKEGDRSYPHREDGPTYIVYYESGEKNYEEWCVNGKLHKIDGPAYPSSS